MADETTRYSVGLTGPFPVNTSKNYVIDLPSGEWDKTAVVKSDQRLKDGDMIRLPGGSWLEVTVDKDCCFGYSGTLYGLLKVLMQSNDIGEEIRNKRAAGKVYQTEATQIV